MARLADPATHLAKLRLMEDGRPAAVRARADPPRGSRYPPGRRGVVGPSIDPVDP